MKMSSKSVSECELTAVIIRADGTREDLGVISYYSKNPIKMAKYKIKKVVRKLWQMFLK